MTQSIFEEFADTLLTNLAYRDIETQRSFFYLDEYPKKHKKYISIYLESGLKIGLVSLDAALEVELGFKDFTINTLCYDILENKFVSNEFT